MTPYHRQRLLGGHGGYRRPPHELVPTRYRSPGLAALMSFIVPGLGQFYNGHFGKGFLFLITSWMIIPYFISIVDAYFSARRISDSNDRFLMQHLILTVEASPQQDAMISPPPLPPMPAQNYARPPLSRGVSAAEREFMIAEADQRSKLQSEKGIIAGSVMTGGGLLLTIASLFYGLGGAAIAAGLAPAAIGAAVGFFSWRKYRRFTEQEKRDEEKRLEKLIVTLAKNTGGVLSAADIVAKTDMGMAEAEEILNRFVVKGYADITVSDKGLIEYHFLVH